jgi:hypothetical protein
VGNSEGHFIFDFLAYQVHKSGRKTSIIIIIISELKIKLSSPNQL